MSVAQELFERLFRERASLEVAYIIATKVGQGDIEHVCFDPEEHEYVCVR